MKTNNGNLLTAKSVFCLLFILSIIGFSSCEKEQTVSISQMELFYTESKGLPEVSIDSIKSFTTKFGNYVHSYPESRLDDLYEPTVDNMRHACSVHGYRLVEVKTTFTVNDEWDGETIIYF